MPESRARVLWLLVVSNILGGIGVASGIAVSALLVQSLGGTALAGVGQALGVLGAAIAAVPLAGVASRRGRRVALSLGYAIATVGGVTVLIAAVLHSLPVLFMGLLLFGCAQATNLQSRYAASDTAAPHSRAKTISLVVWATTLGSVTGPNLAESGALLGGSVGVPGLAGPYLFSVLAFAMAGVLLGVMLPSRARVDPGADADAAPAVTARQALGWAARHPVARFSVLLIAVAHAVMVGLMSMTSVHLANHQYSLRVIGVVISLHILGMYALAPGFGWLSDRIGAMRLSLVGLLLLAVSIVLGVVAGWNADLPTTAVALTLLGLGWSACLISSSALLAGVDAGPVRVPLQGATDALMNYGGAAAATLSAPVLALLGYSGLSVACGVLLVPALVVGWLARREGDSGFDPDELR